MATPLANQAQLNPLSYFLRNMPPENKAWLMRILYGKEGKK